MKPSDQMRADLASVATECVRLASECSRRATSWADHAARWERSKDERMRRASKHASAVAEQTAETATELRAAARAMLDLVAPAS